jgi:hypothetical protein
MPVVTRSQSKKQNTESVSQNTESVSQNTESVSHNTESQKPLYESSFYNILVHKATQIEQMQKHDTASTTKMNLMLDIYRILNQELYKTVQREGLRKWVSFVINQGVKELVTATEFQNHWKEDIIDNCFLCLDKREKLPIKELRTLLQADTRISQY